MIPTQLHMCTESFAASTFELSCAPTLKICLMSYLRKEIQSIARFCGDVAGVKLDFQLENVRKNKLDPRKQLISRFLNQTGQKAY